MVKLLFESVARAAPRTFPRSRPFISRTAIHTPDSGTVTDSTITAVPEGWSVTLTAPLSGIEGVELDVVESSENDAGANSEPPSRNHAPVTKAPSMMPATKELSEKCQVILEQ